MSVCALAPACAKRVFVPPHKIAGEWELASHTRQAMNKSEAPLTPATPATPASPSRTKLATWMRVEEALLSPADVSDSYKDAFIQRRIHTRTLEEALLSPADASERVRESKAGALGDHFPHTYKHNRQNPKPAVTAAAKTRADSTVPAVPPGEWVITAAVEGDGAGDSAGNADVVTDVSGAVQDGRTLGPQAAQGQRLGDNESWRLAPTPPPGLKPPKSHTGISPRPPVGLMRPGECRRRRLGLFVCLSVCLSCLFVFAFHVCLISLPHSYACLDVSASFARSPDASTASKA